MMLKETTFLVKYKDGRIEQIKAELFHAGKTWITFSVYNSSFLDIRDGAFTDIVAIQTDLVESVKPLDTGEKK